MILIGLLGFLSDLRCHSPIIQIHWPTIGSMLSCTSCFSLTACIEESLPGLMDFIFQMCDVACEAFYPTLMPLLSHYCCCKACYMWWWCYTWLMRPWTFKEGGATRAAVVATCALILVHGGVLIGAVVFCSRTAHCFWKLSPLAESVGKLTDHWSAVQCNWGSWKPFDALP